MWQAFLDSLPLTRDVVIEQGRTGWEKIMSPFAAVRSWGLAIGPAYAVQAAFALAAIAATLWLALKGRPELRNAATAAAVLIATPYVLDYDYVVLLLGIAFLWKDGEQHGWGSWEKTLARPGLGRALVRAQPRRSDPVPARPVTASAVLGIAVRRGLTASPSRHSRAASAR